MIAHQSSFGIRIQQLGSKLVSWLCFRAYQTIVGYSIIIIIIIIIITIMYR